MLASGALSVLCGDKYCPDDVLVGLRSFTIVPAELVPRYGPLLKSFESDTVLSSADRKAYMRSFAVKGF